MASLLDDNSVMSPNYVPTTDPSQLRRGMLRGLLDVTPVGLVDAAIDGLNRLPIPGAALVRGAMGGKVAQPGDAMMRLANQQGQGDGYEAGRALSQAALPAMGLLGNQSAGAIPRHQSRQAGALYFRRTNGGPDNGVGHMMFSKDRDSVQGYGKNLHTFNDASPAATGKIVDASDAKFQKEVAAAMRRDYDVVEQYGRKNIAKLASETNPDNIVNSAGVWDDTNLTRLIWEQVLDPSGIQVVRTADGAVVFDPALVRTRGTYPRGR